MAHRLTVKRDPQFTKRLEEYKHIQRLDEYIESYELQLSIDPTKGIPRTIGERTFYSFSYNLDIGEMKYIVVYY